MSDPAEDLPVSWSELGAGAPTIIALARLCSRALVGMVAEEELTLEARAILFAARERGVLELKANNNAFDAIERFLAVHVEVDPHRVMVFRFLDDPRLTARCLDGFRQLCAGGLVVHHLFTDFSLTPAGFEQAELVEEADVADLLERTVKIGFGD